MLDQFNFVALRSVDERNRAPIARRMRTVGQRITLGRSLFCEFFQIVHFKRKMGQVRPHHYWAALVVLANLDLFLALGCFEKDELRSTAGGVSPCFLQTEDSLAHPWGTTCGNLLAAENDVIGLREGFKRARGLAHHSEMDPFRGKELAPGCSFNTDAEIDAWIRNVAITANHPCGTCTMAGEAPVLDPELRVLGIEHLRVVDASAMPDLVSGNINACVLMMAEKAADLILKRKFNRDGRAD